MLTNNGDKIEFFLKKLTWQEKVTEKNQKNQKKNKEQIGQIKPT